MTTTADRNRAGQRAVAVIGDGRLSPDNKRSPERDSHITPGAADHLHRRWLMATIVASAGERKPAGDPA